MDLPELPPAHHVRRSKALLALVILVPLLIMVFLVILSIQQRRIGELEQGTAKLTTDLERERTQEAFYKKAYEITLDDIRTLSEAAGAGDRYARLARDLREKELGTVLGEESPEHTYRLRNTLLWGEYRAKGIIATGCLASPVTADTVQQETLLSITGSAPDAVAYIDGNFLEGFSLNATRTLSVEIPDGDHELDIVLRSGGTIGRVFLDTVELPMAGATADQGTAWAVFDCQNAAAGNFLPSAGAIRISFKKQ